MSARLRILVSLVVVVIALAWPALADAHAFGRRYDLPMPLSLFIAGAAAAVALSFVVVAALVRVASGPHAYPRLNLLRWRLFRILSHSCVQTSLRVLSVALFVLVLLTGFYGMPVVKYNLAPTFVWIIWWVGLAYFCALIGDIWALINPWKIIFAWAERWFAAVSGGRRLSLRLPYPDWLGAYPAVAFYLAFSWMEHAYPGNVDPDNIARAALIYSAMTWTGMFLFGAQTWLRQAEVFSVIFSLFARFAPMEFRVSAVDACRVCANGECGGGAAGCINCFDCYSRAPPDARQWNLRPPAVGLASDRPVHASVLVFILLLLATLAFDGILETPLALDVLNALLESERLAPFASAVEAAGGDVLVVIVTIGLFALQAFFILTYFGFVQLVVLSLGQTRAPHPQTSAPQIACLFVLSLLPIAIAYHLAHYLSFFLINGQGIVALASDPFGFGWDLFGTAYYRIDIGIVDARFAWYSSVVAIVSGHLFAVYIAHIVALNHFRDLRLALRSQYPLLALMVGYTALSLWILAQPIVE